MRPSVSWHVYSKDSCAVSSPGDLLWYCNLVLFLQLLRMMIRSEPTQGHVSYPIRVCGPRRGQYRCQKALFWGGRRFSEVETGIELDQGGSWEGPGYFLGDVGYCYRFRVGPVKRGLRLVRKRWGRSMSRLTNGAASGHKNFLDVNEGHSVTHEFNILVYCVKNLFANENLKVSFCVWGFTFGISTLFYIPSWFLVSMFMVYILSSMGIKLDQGGSLEGSLKARAKWCGLLL